MSMLETVRIKAEVSDDNPLGYIVINKTDFNEDEQELFGDESAATGGKKADLQAALTAKGIAFPANATKAELQALLDQAPAQ